MTKKYDRKEKDPKYHDKIHKIMNGVLDLDYKSKSSNHIMVRTQGMKPLCLV